MSVTAVKTPFETYTVLSGKATLLVAGDEDNPQPGMIANLDLTHILTIGDDMGVTTLRTDTATVQALQAIAYDGTRDIWGIMPTGQTALIEVMPGITYWAPSPAQIAAQISALGLSLETTQQLVKSGVNTTVTNTAQTASNVSTVNNTLGAPAQDVTVSALNPGIPNSIATTGAPPIILSKSMINSGTQVIAAGSFYNNPIKAIGQPGYEIFIQVKCAAGSTTPWVNLTLVWQDSVSGQNVATDNWYLYGGNAAFQQYYGTGPTKGNQLALSVINGDAANATSISVIMLQNSRTYVRDDLRNQTYGNAPNFTAGTQDNEGNYLFATFPAVGANAVVTRYIPVYAGLVQASFLTQGGSAQFSILSNAQAAMQGLAASQVFLSNNVSANSFTNPSLNLPRGNCIVQLINGSTAQSLSLSLTISEQDI